LFLPPIETSVAAFQRELLSIFKLSCPADFDIKTPNVLLTRNYRAKLADIGLGKFLAGEGSLTAKAEQGTL